VQESEEFRDRFEGSQIDIVEQGLHTGLRPLLILAVCPTIEGYVSSSVHFVSCQYALPSKSGSLLPS